MWTLLQLAARNLLRQRSRTAITLTALGFGVFMSLTLGSFITGLQRTMEEELVSKKLGALQVHRKGAFDARNSQPLKLDFDAGGELEKRILATPGVTGAAPRIGFSALVGNGVTSTLVFASAIDPEREQLVVPLGQHDVVGSPVSVENSHGGVLGTALAQALDVKVGSSLTLQASTRDGKENAVDLDLAGTLDGANPLESKRLALVPLAYAQELLRMPGRITEYAVSVGDLEHLDEIAARVKTAVGEEYEVHTWRELRPNVADIFRMQALILGSISFVFLVIAIIGIANTLLMSVIERTREIGTMMAVGVRRAKIASMFVLEAAVMAIAGGSTGALLALTVAHQVAGRGGIGVDLPGSTARFVIVPTIPMTFVVLALVLSSLGAIVAALYPALRAARLRPVEALREA